MDRESNITQHRIGPRVRVEWQSSHSKVWTFLLFSRVIQFGGDFLEILVGNVIKIEKKMKDEATLTFVQYVAKNWETSEYFLNIYEK